MIANNDNLHSKWTFYLLMSDFFLCLAFNVKLYMVTKTNFGYLNVIDGVSFRDIIFSMGKLFCGSTNVQRWCFVHKKACKSVSVFFFFFYFAVVAVLAFSIRYNHSLLIVLRFGCVYAVIMPDQGQRTTRSQIHR